MAFEKHTKTEHGHRKDMAGKAWGGRTMIKEIIGRLRRIKEKEFITEAIEEIKEEEE